jgi:hypothetical protein
MEIPMAPVAALNGFIGRIGLDLRQRAGWRSGERKESGRELRPAACKETLIVKEI